MRHGKFLDRFAAGRVWEVDNSFTSNDAGSQLESQRNMPVEHDAKRSEQPTCSRGQYPMCSDVSWLTMLHIVSTSSGCNRTTAVHIKSVQWQRTKQLCLQGCAFAAPVVAANADTQAGPASEALQLHCKV
jgi:hypothetical protein